MKEQLITEVMQKSIVYKCTDEGVMRKILSIILVALMSIELLTACSGEKESEHTLTFEEGKEISGDVMGVDFDMVGLFFQYTNGSSETIMPADAIGVKAYQSGTELTVMVFTGQKIEGYIQCDTNVQAGTTAGLVWLFQLEDHSTVFVECSDGQRFDVNIFAHNS